MEIIAHEWAKDDKVYVRLCDGDGRPELFC